MGRIADLFTVAPLARAAEMSDRVARVEAFMLTVPRETPYLGTLRPGEEVNERGYFVRRGNKAVYPNFDRNVLVRITTKQGVIGWGETYGIVAPRATMEIITDLLAAFVVGRDRSMSAPSTTISTT